VAKLPFIKFFPRDWMGDDRLRLCSVAARGLWIDLLCLMHSAPRRGYLQTASGSPLPLEQIARMAGCSTDEATRLISELKDAGVCDCSEHGMIYSRRMVREEGKREKCSEAGRKGGGNPAFKGHTKGAAKGEAKQKPNPQRLRGSDLNSPTESSGEGSPDPPSGKNGKPRKEPDSVHHEFVRIFTAAWWVRYRQTYPFCGGKDGDAVKWFRGQVGDDPDRFSEVVGRYLADSEAFVVKQRHSMDLFRKQFVRWLVDKPAPAAPKVRTGPPKDTPSTDLPPLTFPRKEPPA
jgi:hypothetical protein